MHILWDIKKVTYVRLWCIFIAYANLAAGQTNVFLLRITCDLTNAYCPLQFTWRLHSMAVILVLLVTAWFMQRDGTAGINLSENILCGGVRSIVTRAHTVRTNRNVILDGCSEQSMRRAGHTNLPPGRPSVRSQDTTRTTSCIDYLSQLSLAFGCYILSPLKLSW
jgi:hypothetical protein